MSSIYFILQLSMTNFKRPLINNNQTLERMIK